MPELIQEIKRVTALQEIQESLTRIAQINQILEQEMAGGIEILVHGTEMTVPIESRYTAKILSLLTVQRTRLIKSIYNKAEKFRIALNEADTQILNGAIPGPRENRKK